jgi:hypothetical protein
MAPLLSCLRIRQHPGYSSPDPVKSRISGVTTKAKKYYLRDLALHCKVLCHANKSNSISLGRCHLG